MIALHQSPTDPAFVQNPYPFYDRARDAGPLFRWADYNLPCAASHAAVSALLRDRRLGREVPPDRAAPIPPHLTGFHAVEAHSMLDAEPPRHTRLRGLVLRAFTSRRIAALEPEIAALSHALIDAFPDGDVDLLPAFARELPVIVIARLLGVPEAMADDLLAWSNAMVGMYMAGRDRAAEDRAETAVRDFADFLRSHIARRRSTPADDLITHLIAAEQDGARLSTDEMISTCILLLNAGHEATVHTLGNGVKTLLETGTDPRAHAPAPLTEEVLRHDPPLHLFTRHAYEDVDVADMTIRKGTEVGLLLAAANRDPAAYPNPALFDPTRTGPAHVSLGAGIHFCVGAPLARLEIATALPILWDRLPVMRLVGAPDYADIYHFHGLRTLVVTHG